MKNRKYSIIALQFRFPKSNIIPPFLRQIISRPNANRSTNGASPSGKLIVDSTEGVSALAMLNDLKDKGYALVNTIVEERIGDNKHYVARFIFATKGSKQQASETFLRRKQTVERELAEICSTALWKAKVYENPYLQDGAIVGKSASVVMDARRPFMQGDGKPVMVWNKDAAGERIGDAPVPLAPSLHVRTSGIAVRLAA